MAGTIPEAAVPPADIVGNAFVHQYYVILRQSPELVHRFYQDGSKLGRPGENGTMSTTTTMQAINDKILSLGYGEFRAEITSVDSQESYNGGVLVLVTGYLNGNDNVRLKFTQSFFLAPQDNGYYVLNDVFRYVDDPKHRSGNQNHGNNAVPQPTSNQDPPPQENCFSEPTGQTEEVRGAEVHSPSIKEEPVVGEQGAEPVPEVVDKVPEVPQMVADSQTASELGNKGEDLPKKSYASIVKVLKENPGHFSSPASSPMKSAPKSQEQVITSVASSQTTETIISTANTAENGNTQDSEAEGPSIYVKGLPLDANPALVENEFKKFGPIRAGGIQVRFQKGFCFGFVEFEVANALQSALEASPIMINGCRVVVEEKRSTSRGNNRGRFSTGAGAGYRNEGARARGNFGGKGYGRGDFVGRTDYGIRGGNRGGFPSRGADGYRRTDKMGGNAERANRAGGLNFNATAKTTAPRVSATA